uniref:Uncharacterized protein n=1 Tax=Arundo donax TaxID=35708 RepID=A0A0A9GWX5_ARUDO
MRRRRWQVSTNIFQGTSPTSIQSPSLSSYVGTYSVPFTAFTSFLSSSPNFRMVKWEKNLSWSARRSWL